MKLKICVLCDKYDQAQAASRDRRGDQEYFLEILGSVRKEIDELLGSTMASLERDDFFDYPEEDQQHLIELTYFNTWLGRRGGWVG